MLERPEFDPVILQLPSDTNVGRLDYEPDVATGAKLN